MDNPTHINPAFDESLAGMDRLLAAMEDAVAAQLADVGRAFEEMSVDLARRVREKDKQLNTLADGVEQQVVSVLAKHQPLAEDLRHVVGALKMSIEYERAGDYIKHLAKGTYKLALHDERLGVVPSLGCLMKEVGSQFAAFVAARRGNDVEAATRVWLRDGRIDDLRTEAVREAFDNQKKGDGNVHSLIHAMSVAHNSERIGDKIKNLVEIFYQQKTGEALDIKIED